MTVYIDTTRYSRKLKNILEKIGWIVTEEENEADVVVSDSAHKFKPTIILGTPKCDEIPDNVLDVISPRDVNEKILRIKSKLYEMFLNIGNFEEFLEEEFAKAKRYTLPLSLVVIKVLDEDKNSIKKLLKTVRLYSRRSDKIFRLSEDELAIVLLGTDLEGTKVFLKRLSKRWTREYMKDSILKKPDFIYGISTTEEWMKSAEDLLSSAEFDLMGKIR